MTTAVGTFSISSSRDQLSAKAIEAAMVAAIKECHRQGITDSDKVREAMMLAREKVKQNVKFTVRGRRVLISRNMVAYKNTTSKTVVTIPTTSFFNRLMFWRK